MNVTEILLEMVIAGWFFYLGASIGSFGNVVAMRLPRRIPIGLSVSRCPACQNVIRFTDNVPILGWIILLGRCRYCRSPISVRYLFVEIAFGLMFLALYLFDMRWGEAGLAEVFARNPKMPRLDEIFTAKVLGAFGVHVALMSALAMAFLMELEQSRIPNRFWMTVLLMLLGGRVFFPDTVIEWEVLEAKLAPVAVRHAAGRVDLVLLGIDVFLAGAILVLAFLLERFSRRDSEGTTEGMPTSILAAAPIILALGAPAGTIIMILSIVARALSALATALIIPRDDRETQPMTRAFMPSLYCLLLCAIIVPGGESILSTGPFRCSQMLWLLLIGFLLSLVSQWIWELFVAKPMSLNSRERSSHTVP